MNFGKFYIKNWYWFNWIKEKHGFIIDGDVLRNTDFKHIANRITFNIDDRVAYFLAEKFESNNIQYYCRRITLDGFVNVAVCGDNKELIKQYIEEAKKDAIHYDEDIEKLSVDFNLPHRSDKSWDWKFFVIKDKKNNNYSLYEINDGECKLIEVYNDFNETNTKIEKYLERE